MNKINVFINDNLYEIEEIDTIYNICQKFSIEIPTLYLENDITYVEVDGNLFDSTSTNIFDNIRVYTNTELVHKNVFERINNIYSNIKCNCKKCPIINCSLKNQFDKHNLNTDIVDSYKECNYYINGLKSQILKEKEYHENLANLLKDKSVHKLAIIDKKMNPKKAEILKRGFNEVITSDFLKKFKIIEESALILKEIEKHLDNRENKVPCVILEDSNKINLVPHHLRKNIINVGSLADIAKRLFTISLDYQDIRLIFVTENEFDNSSSEVITYDYLMELEEINNLEINNIAKLLKIDFKEVNYNSFVKHMVDIFKTKQNCDIDIYQTAEYTINLNKQEIKITNYNFNQQENTHVILFLDNESKNITGSIIDDVDVNYVYKNYIKYPGNM